MARTFFGDLVFPFELLYWYDRLAVLTLAASQAEALLGRNGLKKEMRLKED